MLSSAAYISVLIVISDIFVPLKSPLSNTPSISLRKRINKKGDKLSPCRTPQLYSKLLLSTPLYLTLKVVLQ